ncbi:hypothetical protein PR048_033620 [Dryococelus australis]|uniref:Uncharacterized protein n=1 Tax=Dryococelus australis TaxID=614101 RepID=A0ABQ9G3M2_9NEOP|nr:hypothetical protein PR048_033620 [Dryococelus australis]
MGKKRKGGGNGRPPRVNPPTIGENPGATPPGCALATVPPRPRGNQMANNSFKIVRMQFSDTTRVRTTLTGEGETGDHRENPPTIGIENSGTTLQEFEPGSPWWEASSLTTTSPRHPTYKFHGVKTSKREKYDDYTRDKRYMIYSAAGSGSPIIVFRGTRVPASSGTAIIAVAAGCTLRLWELGDVGVLPSEYAQLKKHPAHGAARKSCLQTRDNSEQTLHEFSSATHRRAAVLPWRVSKPRRRRGVLNKSTSCYEEARSTSQQVVMKKCPDEPNYVISGNEWRKYYPQSRRHVSCNPFTVTPAFYEALLMFYFQDIPPSRLDNYNRGTKHRIPALNIDVSRTSDSEARRVWNSSGMTGWGEMGYPRENPPTSLQRLPCSATCQGQCDNPRSSRRFTKECRCRDMPIGTRDNATRIKSSIAPKRKALNWRTVFSSCCVYPWHFQRRNDEPVELQVAARVKSATASISTVKSETDGRAGLLYWMPVPFGGRKDCVKTEARRRRQMRERRTGRRRKEGKVQAAARDTIKEDVTPLNPLPVPLHKRVRQERSVPEMPTS